MKTLRKELDSRAKSPVPFSMTEIEGKYLSRVPKTSKGDWLFDTVLGITIGILIACVLMALFISWRADKAEASYIPTTNQEFCAEIAEGKWTVLDTPKEEVTALCAKYL